MQISRELKQDIRMRVEKAIVARAKHNIAQKRKEYAAELAKLNEISKQYDMLSKQKEAIKKRIVTKEEDRSNQFLTFRDYASDGSWWSANTDRENVENIANKIVLKLQYEKADLSKISELIDEVLS